MNSLPSKRGAPGPLFLASSPILLFLVLPLAVLVTESRPKELFDHLNSPLALRALWVTLRTTVVDTVFCVAGGLPVAFLLARFQFRGKNLMDTLPDLPVAVPPVVAGVALLLTFGRQDLIGKQFDFLGIPIIDACINNALFGRGDFGAPTRREEGA